MKGVGVLAAILKAFLKPLFFFGNLILVGILFSKEILFLLTDVKLILFIPSGK